ncbi:DUF7518 family protein [Halobaculum sp. D14]|uniref:DUF7518 family protein n=1 Tax=unclassified Halobaculum TaxID=2640896 RepID=UPI003EBCE7DD
MGNRVEDLEKQVAELQAAVDGLTEELVETKERISQLEAATTVEESGSESGDSHAEFVPNESATEQSAADDDGPVESEGSAQTAARGGSEEDADADGDDGDDGDAEDSDDIIVA